MDFNRITPYKPFMNFEFYRVDQTIHVYDRGNRDERVEFRGRVRNGGLYLGKYRVAEMKSKDRFDVAEVRILAYAGCMRAIKAIEAAHA